MSIIKAEVTSKKLLIRNEDGSHHRAKLGDIIELTNEQAAGSFATHIRVLDEGEEKPKKRRGRPSKKRADEFNDEEGTPISNPASDKPKTNRYSMFRKIVEKLPGDRFDGNGKPDIDSINAALAEGEEAFTQEEVDSLWQGSEE